MRIIHVLVFIFVFATKVHGDATDGLRNFLEYSILGEFGDWIAFQNLDPTPPIVGETFNITISNGLYEFEAEFSGIVINGLSNTNAYPNLNDLYNTDFIRNEIGFRFQPGWAGLSGSYNGSGQILGSIPISGSGAWFMKSNPFSIEFRKRFYIVAGHIELLEDIGYMDEFSFETRELEADFEALFTPETAQFEEEIMIGVADALRYQAFYDYRLFHGFLDTFLRSRFSTVPVLDIINWPYPTPTSTAPTVGTSTTQATTTPEWTTTTWSPCGKRGGDTRSEGLNNFLYWSFLNYGSWLIENELDPSPPITSPASLMINNSFLELNSTYRDTTGTGMSTPRLRIMDIFSDFLTPQFRFRIEIPDLTISGTFEAEGSIISTYPITGSGPWTMGIPDLTIEVQILGFAIQDGFINPDSFGYRNVTVRSWDDEYISMPSLVEPEDADGLGAEVLTTLADAIPIAMHDQGKHPIVTSVLDYLKVIFSETPLTEIIATTPPPWPCNV